MSARGKRRSPPEEEDRIVRSSLEASLLETDINLACWLMPERAPKLEAPPKVAVESHGRAEEVPPRPAGKAWCERGDSNPHGFPRQILSLVRLPVPPLSHVWNHSLRHLGSLPVLPVSIVVPLATLNCRRRTRWRKVRIPHRHLYCGMSQQFSNSAQIDTS